ncbi:nodulation protein NodZ [Sphingomonas sp. RS6]
MIADPTDKYLCVKGKAGLGNRMQAAITGWLYAQLSGRRFVPDWSDFTYSNEGENVFHALFACEGSLSALPGVTETSVAPPIWIDHLDKSADEMVTQFGEGKHSGPTLWRNYSIDLSRLDHPERYAMFWSYTQHIKLLRPHFKGQWADWARLSDDQVIARVLQQHIVLSDAIRAKVDAFKAAEFAGEVIGVHVRYMDRKTSIRDFLRHIDRLHKQKPDALIFLATDNKDAETMIRGRYPKVVTTPKWFPEGGVSMHQNPECPDRLNNAVEALVDMYLLAECDYLIFPGSSTFSKIASLISHMPRGHVIDIERYSPRIRLKQFIKSLVQ